MAEVVVLHFVASWAAAQCDPHRAEGEQAAEALGLGVTVYDVDEQPEQARKHGVLNVPAVALSQGRDMTAIHGAFRAQELISRLRDRL